MDFGGGPLRVVIDPIDGSMNAKRGLSPHAVSIAVADGETMADVFFGYVRRASARRGVDRLARRRRVCWTACRSRVTDAERRTRDGRLELVALEAAHPALDRRAAGRPEPDRLPRADRSARWPSRCASSPAGRVDGMATLGPARSVDVAAAQLIVRESGGLVAFTAFEEPLGAPLDLVARSPVVAARTAAGLAELATLPSSVSMIDWNLARRIAETIGGQGGAVAAPHGDLGGDRGRLAGARAAPTRGLVPTVRAAARRRWSRASSGSRRTCARCGRCSTASARGSAAAWACSAAHAGARPARSSPPQVGGADRLPRPACARPVRHAAAGLGRRAAPAAGRAEPRGRRRAP